MDLASPKTIRSLAKKYGLLPSRRLGQNFLIEGEAVRGVVEAAGLQPDDTVLEIGPGLGVLTQELAKKAKRVVAVEKDQKMVEILKETLKDFNNIKIIRSDILKIGNLGIENSYKVVGNLPFYLTAPLIRKFLESVEVKPRQLVLVVQKEVAQRICAKPPKMNLLAVSIQFYAEPKTISYISKKSFWPSPEVDAAVIKIIPKTDKNSTMAQNLSDLFFKIVRAGFSQPRKQLINNFSKALKIDKKKVEEWLRENGIKPNQRAETLTVENWVNLTKTFVL